ncbi:MAG: hypothetical protein ACOCP8_04440 [archaeon]
MFSIPFNQTKEIFKIYEKYNDIISEVYFPISPKVLYTARIIDWDENNEKLLEDLIVHLNSLNIEPNMLLNSINDPRIYTKEGTKDILSFLVKCYKIGLRRITIANPILFRVIRDIMPDDFKIGLSIVSNITTMEQLKQYYENGIDEYCIPPQLSRNKDFICAIRKHMPELKLKLMVNCFCNPNCVGFMHHHVAVSNFKSDDDKKYFDYVCVHPFMNPLKKNFIFPGEVDLYREYIDIFKISGREFTTEHIDFILDNYKNKNNDEYNLLKLLDGFKLEDSILVNKTYKQQPRNVKKIQNCDFKCLEKDCSYCDEILITHFDYNEGKQREY